MDKEREIQQGKNIADVAKVRKLVTLLVGTHLTVIGTKYTASDLEQSSLRLKEQVPSPHPGTHRAILISATSLRGQIHARRTLRQQSHRRRIHHLNRCPRDIRHSRRLLQLFSLLAQAHRPRLQIVQILRPYASNHQTSYNIRATRRGEVCQSNLTESRESSREAGVHCRDAFFS